MKETNKMLKAVHENKLRIQKEEQFKRDMIIIKNKQKKEERLDTMFAMVILAIFLSGILALGVIELNKTIDNCDLVKGYQCSLYEAQTFAKKGE